MVRDGRSFTGAGGGDCGDDGLCFCCFAYQFQISPFQDAPGEFATELLDVE